MSTVKMVSFLNSLLRVRKPDEGSQSPKILESIKTRSIYLPTRLADPNSAYRKDLGKICKSFNETHTRPYMPGDPIGDEAIGLVVAGGDLMGGHAIAIGTGWI